METQKQGYPKVVIIILNWNGLDDTIECIESLKRISYPNYAIVVVDNASQGDDAVQLKKRYGDTISLIINDHNYGVSRGFNSGIRYAMTTNETDYIIKMNNDMVVAPDFLDELIKVAEGDDQIGIVGPKIYYYNFQGASDIIWSAGGTIRPWAVKICQQVGQGSHDLPKYQTIRTVDWITGALHLTKRSVIEAAGLLDPCYFFGYGDVEYCLRARRHGFRIVYVPTARIWHKVGVSAEKAHRTYAEPLPYYHLIQHSFPLYIYLYHLGLMPLLILRWALFYLLKRRDRHSLRTFFSEILHRSG